MPFETSIWRSMNRYKSHANVCIQSMFGSNYHLPRPVAHQTEIHRQKTIFSPLWYGSSCVRSALLHLSSPLRCTINRKNLRLLSEGSGTKLLLHRCTTPFCLRCFWSGHACRNESGALMRGFVLLRTLLLNFIVSLWHRGRHSQKYTKPLKNTSNIWSTFYI